MLLPSPDQEGGIVGTTRALGSTSEVSGYVARTAERSRNIERAYAIFRITMGFAIFMHGFSRILTGVAAFVAVTEKPFVKTIIPMPVVHYFLTILPYLEFAVGALLIVGLFTMEASIAGALIMIILIFGMGARQEWSSVGNEMIYAAWYFLLIALNENNWLCIDRLQKKPS
jgi:thiosulfate dehydrogenase (quinone) large subunit